MAITQQKLYKVTKVKVRKPTPDVICPHCSKRVAARGLQGHINLVHGISKNEREVSQKVSQKMKDGGFTPNNIGNKVRIKKTGEIGIIIRVDPVGKADIMSIEEIRSLYEKHCK